MIAVLFLYKLFPFFIDIAGILEYIKKYEEGKINYFVAGHCRNPHGDLFREGLACVL